MEFNPDNDVVKLCAKGMEMEGSGQPTEAARLFNEAWSVASNDFEKFTAAHYVARHQQTIAEKLEWDLIALKHALNIPEESIKATLPSLYLNIAKGYEDLDQTENAKNNYLTAASYCNYLSDDGYGKMIQAGIASGLKRTS